jgi:hypothetical protein
LGGSVQTQPRAVEEARRSWLRDETRRHRWCGRPDLSAASRRRRGAQGSHAAAAMVSVGDPRSPSTCREGG